MWEEVTATRRESKMGYTTDFLGHFIIDKKVDEDTFNLMNGLAGSRRMKRSGLPDKYGVEGEFYFETENMGQNKNPLMGEIVEYNTPPRTQPSLWLQWVVEDDHQTIRWDGSEKFYNYIGWIKYLIEKILKPRGYKVNGAVSWQGEDKEDVGTINITENVVSFVSALTT